MRDAFCFHACRYPIQKPREGCYGDITTEPGVRNYGTMAQDQLYDVYCYVEEIHGMKNNTYFYNYKSFG